MKSSTPTVYVSRAVINAGLDLGEVTQLVNKAIWEQFSEFGALSEWDLVPIEIHDSFVIVQDLNKLKYYMAKYSIDKANVVKFKEVTEVKRKWATVKSVERSTDDELIPTYWTPPTTWGNILGKSYE